MLKRFAFRGKIYYLCTSEEERALNTGFFPLFFAHYKGRKTSEVGNSICFCGFSKCFCGFSKCFIGARNDDVENFSRPKILKILKVFARKKLVLTFGVTTQVVPECESM